MLWLGLDGVRDVVVLWLVCGCVSVGVKLGFRKSWDSIRVDNTLNLITTVYQSVSETTSSACTSSMGDFRHKKKQNTLNRSNEII